MLEAKEGQYTLCFFPLLDKKGLQDIESPFECQVAGLFLVGKWVKRA
jgi:hypothetical protein